MMTTMNTDLPSRHTGCFIASGGLPLSIAGGGYESDDLLFLGMMSGASKGLLLQGEV